MLAARVSDPSSEPPPPTPRRVTLDVVLKRDARTQPAHVAAQWSTQRTWVLTFFILFCAASWYAWVELRGHPIANYVSALPQLTAVFAAMTTLLGGGDPNIAKNWYQARANRALEWIDGHARSVCIGLALATLVIAYAGHSMIEVEVQCPAGCQLSYGALGAVTSCDQHHDRIWAPLGLESVVPTFECSMPGGHGEWEPLRRSVRDTEGTHEIFTCYEDGARVVSHAPRVAVEYLEYGWADGTPARNPAPCDHLPVGLYSYDPAANTCTWLMTLDALTQLFRDAEAAPGADQTTQAALRRLIGSACHDCPEQPSDADAGVPADGGVPAPTPTPTVTARAARRAHDASRPDSCTPPETEPFTFFAPDGCHGDFGDVVLELPAREVAIGVGISFRGGDDRRCVPSEMRRDGYVHLLLPDGELVFAVTHDAPRRVLLVEDVRSTSPPPALGTTCPP